VAGGPLGEVNVFLNSKNSEKNICMYVMGMSMGV
jgi:hypothetical protein